MCAPSFLVCARLMTCVHTHSLEGTLLNVLTVGLYQYHPLLANFMQFLFWSMFWRISRDYELASIPWFFPEEKFPECKNS